MNFDTTASQNDTNENTVQVMADARSTLRAFSASFTASLTVISELLQNGRRAGATRIDVHVTDDVIVVQDNGIGLDDFSILLKIGESGWNDQIEKADSPYGVGFLAAVFSAEHLGVMSKGKHLFAPTADLIDLKKVVVNESGDLGVTEIRLHNYTVGSRYQVEMHLQQVVKGFPIPVFLNGKELERPHALEFLDTIETGIGHATTGVKEAKWASTFYLQGLPINVPVSFGIDRHKGFLVSQPTVIHLDSIRFKGRMPDRDKLRDAEAAVTEIEAELKAIAVAHVLQLSQSMAEREFVAKYAGLANYLDMRDLLNGMSVFPSKWVRKFVEMPRQSPGGNSSAFLTSTEHEEALMTRDDVLSSGLFTICDDDPEDLLAQHALFDRGGLVTGRLPAWHWASELVQSVSSADFVLVPGNVIAEESVDIYGWDITLVLVDSLKARYVEPSEEDADDGYSHVLEGTEFDVNTYYDGTKSRLYVQKGTEANEAAWQVTNFESDDHYDEGAEWDTVTSLRATMQMLNTQEASALLETFISNGKGSASPKAFIGKTFKVSFDETGKMTVAEEA